MAAASCLLWNITGEGCAYGSLNRRSNRSPRYPVSLTSQDERDGARELPTMSATLDADAVLERFQAASRSRC